MIIWLASYPRSGNTYFRILLSKLYDFETYSIYPEDSTIVGLSPEMAQSEEFYFIKTHELPQQDDYPAIYLVRDGRDSLVSYARFIESYGLANDKNFETILRDLIRETKYFGGWQQHILAWTTRQAPTVVIRYEDLIKPEKTKDVLAYAFAQLNLKEPDLVKSDLSFDNDFAELHKEDPKVFRKGKVDSWVEEFPLELHNLFWEFHGKAMDSLGYERKGDLLLRHLEAKRLHEADVNSIITGYEKLLEQQREMILLQNRELEAKEEVIQQLRKYRFFEPAYWYYNHLRPNLKKVKAKLLTQTVQTAITNRLRIYRNVTTNFSLAQYSPIPLAIPPEYYQVSLPDLEQLPTVSIVTPSYNQGRFIERTIQSVILQGYPKLEYFVQDGASQDETKAVLAQYASQITGYESAPDQGQTDAINKGFLKTQGEIMAWLNSDDLLLPGAIKYVVKYFSEHPEVDAVYGHRILIDEEDQEIGRWILPNHNPQVLTWADYVPQETLFWRRSLWEKTGAQVDVSFRFAMDWDLLLRFQQAEAKIVRLPRFLGAFRIHSSQKTSASINTIGEEEMNRLRQQYHGRQVTQAEINAQVKPYWRQSGILRLLYGLGVVQY